MIETVQLSETPENDLGYIRPWMYDKQFNAIFNEKRYAVIEASTKSGKTVGCIVWLTEKAVLTKHKNRNYWWVAPVSDQADIAFRRTCYSLPQSMFKPNLSRNYITILHNNSRIWFKSGDKPDSLYGEDVYGAVVDEASRVKVESWYALRSTITATRAPVRIIGNVKGRGNWMYRMALLAKSGEHDDMSYAKITAYDAVDAGVLAIEEIEDAKKIYPEDEFKQLYLAEPADDGGNPFGIAHIYACIADMSTNKPVCWGWDVAKHNNWTVGIGLDDNGAVCEFYRFQDTWDTTMSKIIKATNQVPSLVDSTGSGDQLLERLHIDGHHNFKGQLFGGWKAKYDLMLGLSLAIQNHDVTFPEGRIVEELECFEYYAVPNSDRYIYAAPNGMHDDCVDALAMAVKLWVKRNKFSGVGLVPRMLEKQSSWSIT